MKKKKLFYTANYLKHTNMKTQSVNRLSLTRAWIDSRGGILSGRTARCRLASQWSYLYVTVTSVMTHRTVVVHSNKSYVHWLYLSLTHVLIWQINSQCSIRGSVAQRITRLTTDQKIPGSNPGRLVMHFYQTQWFSRQKNISSQKCLSRKRFWHSQTILIEENKMPTVLQDVPEGAIRFSLLSRQSPFLVIDLVSK